MMLYQALSTQYSVVDFRLNQSIQLIQRQLVQSIILLVYLGGPCMSYCVQFAS